MKNLAESIRDSSLLEGKTPARKGKLIENYLDIRKAYGEPSLLNEMADRLREKMQKDATCVVGYGLGGLPLATAISSRHNLKLCVLREEPKKYGTYSQIESYTPTSHDKAIIVDDVFTTGSSLREAMKILRPTNTQIVCCGAVVHRGEGNPSVLEIPFTYLFTLKELLST